MEHSFYDNEKAENPPKTYQRKKEDHEFDLLIDIQKKLAQGKGKYYVRFAKKFNTKQVAKAVLYLKQHDIRSYDDLEKNVKTATERFTKISASIKEKEKRLAEIQVLKKHIFDYFKTKDVYADYRKSGYSKKFLEEHRQEILLHKAAKNAFDELHLKKLPMVFDYVCDIEVHMKDELEFYQIKTHSKSQSAYTTESLTKKKSKNSQGSILGKLFVLNATEGHNNLIAIVSNSPYKMPGNDIYNGIHCFNDFPELEKEKIINAIKTELNVEEVDLSTAFYICTSMDLENPQNAITGQLVLSFEKLKGCEVERPATIYSLIMIRYQKRHVMSFRLVVMMKYLKKKELHARRWIIFLIAMLKVQKLGLTKRVITLIPFQI